MKKKLRLFALVAILFVLAACQKKNEVVEVPVDPQPQTKNLAATRIKDTVYDFEFEHLDFESTFANINPGIEGKLSFSLLANAGSQLLIGVNVNDEDFNQTTTKAIFSYNAETTKSQLVYVPSINRYLFTSAFIISNQIYLSGVNFNKQIDMQDLKYNIFKVVSTNTANEIDGGRGFSLFEMPKLIRFKDGFIYQKFDFIGGEACTLLNYHDGNPANLLITLKKHCEAVGSTENINFLEHSIPMTDSVFTENNNYIFAVKRIANHEVDDSQSNPDKYVIYGEINGKSVELQKDNLSFARISNGFLVLETFNKVEGWYLMQTLNVTTNIVNDYYVGSVGFYYGNSIGNHRLFLKTTTSSEILSLYVDDNGDIHTEDYNKLVSFKCETNKSCNTLYLEEYDNDSYIVSGSGETSVIFFIGKVLKTK